MNYMPFSTAPALFAGLSARILLDLFTRTEPAALRDHVLIGVWQGVALHYAFKNSALIPIAFGIAAKLLIELALVHDTIKCATTLLGVILGFVCTDFLSQFLDEPIPEAERRRKKSYPPLPVPQRQRVVQFQPSIEREDISVDIPPHWASLQTSDITSVDSNSELIRHKQSMTPVEREVAALRARASLADSERRRYKEERKWADSQGNIARAAQMKWQVKRYTALMQSFHREADLKLIEASNGRSREHDEQKPIATGSRGSYTRPRKEESTTERSVAVDIRPSHHRSQTGPPKPAIREFMR